MPRPDLLSRRRDGAAPSAQAMIREVDPAVSALRFFLSAYFLVLGVSLVMLPTHGPGGTIVEEWPRGLLTAFCGLGLLWLGLLRIPRTDVRRALHVAVAAPQMAIGLTMIVDGSLVSGATLLAFGTTAAFLPLEERRRPASPRGDLLTHLLLGVVAIQGIGIVFELEGAGSIPSSVDVPPLIWGTLLTNCAILAAVLAFLRRAAGLTTGLVLLVASLTIVQVIIAAATIDGTIVLLSGATYLRAGALATYPIRSRMRLDWASLRAAGTVGLVTAAVLPVLLIGVADQLTDGDAPDPATREVRFALASVVVVGAFLVGWFAGGSLAQPIRALAARVTGMRRGATPRIVPAMTFTELDMVAKAIDATTADLAAERVANARLIAELRAATAAKDEFLSLVSHELRTPITTVLGTLTMLDRRDLSEGTRDLVDDARAEAERLSGIVDNLLTLARLEAGRRPETEPVLLAPLVARIAAATGRQHPDHPFTIAGEGRSIVEANEDHLEMVVRNLLSNAAKYSPPGSPIEVVVTEGPERVTVTVLDRGPGIAEADRDRVFEPFFRTEATARAVAGIGIGLAVCRRVLHAIGASIWVGDRPEGSGAAFHIALPLAVDEHARADAPASASTHSGRASPGSYAREGEPRRPGAGGRAERETPDQPPSGA